MTAPIAFEDPAPRARGMHDDTALWATYAAAATDLARASAAGAIVEFHLPFLRWYADLHAQRAWGPETRADYLAEIVAVAFELVPRFDPERGAAFVTFVKPHLRPVRWKVAGALEAVAVGVETARLTAEIGRLVADGERDPEAIAAVVSKLHGKPIGPARVRRIIAQGTTVRGDAPMGEPGAEGSDRWALLAAGGPSAEDQALDAIEGSISGEVSLRLDAMPWTDLERAIITERLMAPATDLPAVDRHALELGVSVAELRATERRVRARLRSELGDLAGPGQPRLL